MIEYPPIAIQKWCEYISGNNESRKWLVENNYRELAEFWDAYENMEKSFQWLKNNGFLYLAACVDAMDEKPTAKAWLMRYGYPQLAAFADASEGNQQAIAVLVQAEQYDLVRVAKTIFDNQKKKKKSIWNIFNFGNPFR